MGFPSSAQAKVNKTEAIDKPTENKMNIKKIKLLFDINFYKTYPKISW